MDAIKIDKKNTLLISDGGNQINEIDHTYPAFVGACNKNYDGILVYVRFTKDRIIVCSRTRTLYRFIKKKIHISQSKYKEIEDINLKKPFSYITKLSDILELITRYHKKIYLRLCQPIGHLEISQLCELLTEHFIKHVSIVVNDSDILMKFRKWNKDANLILDVTKVDDDIINICKENNFAILSSIDSNILENLDKIKNNHLKIGIKNVDNPIDASIIINNQVDFIITKYLE